jgi:integrase
MFSLAIKWRWVTANPTKGVKRYTEAKRTRYLKADELSRLTAALDTFPNQQVANIVRLLLLTGARRGEVLSATWDHLDLEAGVWSKPAHLTKQNKPHETPLGEAAIALLKRIRRDAPEDERVFSIAGEPMRDIKRQWEALREAAELPGVRLHDLRHTFASMLASGGASLPMIGALLGHASPVTTARYAHLFQDPLRALANEVGRVVEGAESAEVAPIRKDGAA